jgi:hypothetical protein
MEKRKLNFNAMHKKGKQVMDKILLNKILSWLDSNINKDNYIDNKEIQEALAVDSSELKEKIELYLDGLDEF